MIRIFVGLAILAAVGPSLVAEPVRARQKLYVTNSQGNDVTVVDLGTNKVLGRIEVGPHPHGIAAPASQEFILVTVEGSNPGELVWIDPKTDKVTKRIPVGPAPNQLAVTPDGKLAYVPVSDGYYEVVDLQKQKIVERIHTGGRPHNTLCSVDGKHMYLAPTGASKKIIIVDTATHKPIGNVPFGNSIRPVALSRDEKHFYAQTDNLIGFEVADLLSRRVVHRIEADLTAEQKKVPSRSHGMDLRPDQKELWTCDVEHFEVQVYDLTGDAPKQMAAIPMGGRAYWLTFAPDGKICYVAVRSLGEIAAVDTATKKIVARIPAGKEPKRLLVVNVP